MSFEYRIVKEKDHRDCEKQVNYFGAKGYKILRIWERNDIWRAVMERFKPEGGEPRR